MEGKTSLGFYEESFIFCGVNVPFVTNLLVAVVSQSTSSMVGLTVQGEKVCS